MGQLDSFQAIFLLKKSTRLLKTIELHFYSLIQLKRQLVNNFKNYFLFPVTRSRQLLVFSNNQDHESGEFHSSSNKLRNKKCFVKTYRIYQVASACNSFNYFAEKASNRTFIQIFALI